ncbi:MAG: hypothetical protein IKS55_07540 [Oscillospiraceae bacterium]|nr:hypothetical protein [Oscillospiraceae bacterium]
MVKIMCLIILALEARGLYISISERHWKIFAFYTQLSNIITAVSAILVIILGQTPFTTLLRYLSSCMLLMTFLVTACVLVPMGADAKQLLFSGNGVYHHLLIPIISIASYLLLEQHVKSASAILLPTVITFLYGVAMLWLNYKGLFDGPYPFFRVRNQSLKATVLWMTILIAAIAALSAVLFLLGR